MTTTELLDEINITILNHKHWKTKEGKIIPISKMEDSHLINVIRYFNKIKTPETLLNWRSYQGVVEEANKRKLYYGDDWDS